MITSFDNIPQELKDRSQWVCWVLIPDHKNPAKPKKVPINPKTGKAASTANPATWGTFDQAIKHFNKGGCKGIGFVFSENDPYVGIDLDNCRNKETGDIQPWAQEIISSFASYTELSPSKTGLHIIVKGQLHGKGKKVGDIETYDKGRYFTFTGDLLPESPLAMEPRQAGINSLYSRLSKKKHEHPKGNNSSESSNMTDDQIIGNALFAATGCNLQALIDGNFSAYPSQSEADLAFCSCLAKITGSAEAIDRIFRKSKLMRDKWDEKRGELTYGEITVAKALEGRGAASSSAESNTTSGGTADGDESQFAIARAVIQEIGRDNMIYTIMFWFWDQMKGIWRIADDREIKQVIHSFAVRSKLSRSLVDSILELIKTEVYSLGHVFDVNNRIINCPNGELHYVNGAWELRPHDRDNYCTQQTSVAYDKTAEAPRFLKFIKEIFAFDSDWLEKIKILQEFMGYALIPSCVYERFLLLVGQGANGKSVWLRLVEALVGLINVAGVQPSQFENKFQLAHLQGKLVNIITEIPQGAVIKDAILKAIASGELMTAEKKHCPPFDFRPFCTMLFATNHMPHTQDCSQAFFRRAEIVTFNRKFEGPERDVHLKDKLIEELPGILNFALAGLKRLYDEGDFTKLPSSEEAKQEWERDVDQVVAFVEDECELCPDVETKVGDLFMQYLGWVTKNGIHSKVNAQTLTTRLVRLGCQRRRGAQGTRIIVGIQHRQA